MKVSEADAARERLHKILGYLPGWILTIICLAAILWLTLSPRPLGEIDMPLFPGADKAAHAVMFFGLTLCILLDAMRARHWKPLTLPLIALISIIGMGAGIGIEYLQQAMELGREFEFADMVADAFGAIAAGALWILIGGTLRLTDHELQQISRKSSGRK